MTRRLALLRAVNVGDRKLLMADLRALCAQLGWQGAETYIQSGNLLFEAEGEGGELEAVLERAIADSFGFEAPTMVRTHTQWSRLVEANPFPAEAEEAPSQVFLALPKRPLAAGGADAIALRARDGERVAEAGGALWIHFPRGAGKSRITPASIDRAAGGPVTARNWRTVLALAERLG